MPFIRWKAGATTTDRSARSRDHSPRAPLLAVANEVSGTTTIFSISALGH